jgi:hypothetical protein
MLQKVFCNISGGRMADHLRRGEDFEVFKAEFLNWEKWEGAAQPTPEEICGRML